MVGPIRVYPPYSNGLVVHATFFSFLSYYSLKRILTIFFFFSPIFGLKQPEFRKKVVFCLVPSLYTLSGPITKKNFFFFMCVFPNSVLFFKFRDSFWTIFRRCTKSVFLGGSNDLGSREHPVHSNIGLGRKKVLSCPPVEGRAIQRSKKSILPEKKITFFHSTLMFWYRKNY